MTRHETHPEDTDLYTAFEAYTRRHYQSWVRLAHRRSDGNNIHPILVTGFDMTTDFSVVAYPNEDGVPPHKFANPIPMFAQHFLGEWWARCSVHRNEGSQQPGDANQPNQCVFIRYYTMRWRFFLRKVPKVPTVVPAGARPHNLDPGENKGGAFQELPAQSDPEYSASDHHEHTGSGDPENTENNNPEHTRNDSPRNTGSDGQDPGQQYSSAIEDTGSGSNFDIRNPPYVWFLLSLSVSALNFVSRRNMTPGM